MDVPPTRRSAAGRSRPPNTNSTDYAKDAVTRKSAKTRRRQSRDRMDASLIEPKAVCLSRRSW